MSIQTLRDFNERVDILRDFVMADFADGRPLAAWNIVATELGQEATVQGHGFKDITMHAIANNLRVLTQNNDPLALSKLPAMYDHLGVSGELIDQLQEVRTLLNSFLDEPSSIRYNDRRMTNRDLYHTFLYGHFSHTHEKHRKDYRAWRAAAMFMPIAEAMYLHVVFTVLTALFHVYEFNLRAIQELEERGAA